MLQKEGNFMIDLISLLSELSSIEGQPDFGSALFPTAAVHF